MSGPPNAGTGEIRYRFTGIAAPRGAQVSVGVFWTGDEETMLDVALAGWENELRATAVTNLTLAEIALKRGPSATGPTFIRTVGQAGTRSAPNLAPNTSYLVRKIVPAISGRFSGRLYWPAPDEGQVGNDGIVAPAWLSTMQTAWDDYYDLLVTEGMQPQVFSADSSDSRAFTSFSVSNVVATQRRRLRR